MKKYFTAHIIFFHNQKLLHYNFYLVKISSFSYPLVALFLILQNFDIALYLSLLLLLSSLSNLIFLFLQYLKAKKYNNIKYLKNQNYDFLIAFDATPNGGQLGQWIKYFDLTNKKYCFVTLRKANYNFMLQASYDSYFFKNYRSIETHLKCLVKNSIFYVNNGNRNFDLISLLPEIKHLQLFHGESDKPPSYSRKTIVYDKVFVAGQMAVDRYKIHDVKMPQYIFEYSGRPQAAELNSIKNPQEIVKDNKVLTLGLFPTWSGVTDGHKFTAVDFLPQIVDIALKNNFRIIFRPHPRSYSDPAQNKIIKEIEQKLIKSNQQNNLNHIYSDNSKPFSQSDLTNLLNQSDILVGDLSSVVYDFLYSLKPYVLIDIRNNPKSFLENFPIANGGYVLDSKLKGFEELIKNLAQGDDKNFEAREKLRKYILGENAGSPDYIQHFVDCLLKYI